MVDRFLTLPEVAAVLKVAEKTVYTMAERSQMPAFKARGQRWFKRTDIIHWINDQKDIARMSAAKGNSHV